MFPTVLFHPDPAYVSEVGIIFIQGGDVLGVIDVGPAGQQQCQDGHLLLLHRTSPGPWQQLMYKCPLWPLSTGI